MSGPRISYVEPKNLKDPEMLKELERCASIGTPRPESQSIRACGRRITNYGRNPSLFFNSPPTRVLFLVRCLL